MDSSRIYDFVEENMKTIFAYALSRVSHKEDAEDLADEIIFAILKSADQIKNEDALFGYVWKIAANTYKKFLRKKIRASVRGYDDTLLNAIPSRDDFTNDMIKLEQISVLRREMSLLSREYRECTVAYYFDGLSCAETSEKLGISLEMVKYYLFKTRKLLKEGIVMEREFGEKSYKPGKFEFNTIFSGEFNREYTNLFNRKLPGNILLSAYYTPMTIRELSVELGVASAYMEDEVALLEKYKLLTSVPGCKYQTNLVIFTEEYDKEFNSKAESEFSNEIRSILQSVRIKLPEIRKIGFVGNQIDDNRLMWALLFPLIRDGSTRFESPISDEIYNGTTGINYGVAYDEYADVYGCFAFAGYAKIDEQYAAAFADYGVLPVMNRYGENEMQIKEHAYAVKSGTEKAYIPIVNHAQRKQIETMLSEEAERFKQLYQLLAESAVKILKVHAPKTVGKLAEKIINRTIFYRTVGLIGKCAVASGELTLPSDDKPIAVLIYETA